jgi:hypothetical protein
VPTNLLVGGRLEQIPLEQLEPDALNPRLPPGVQAQLMSPDELYPYIDRAYDAISIAESIVRHGYFESEPMIAVRKKEAYKGVGLPSSPADHFVVVEGNRRLTALKGLADLDVRTRLPSRRWKQIPQQVKVPEAIPVLVVSSREKAAPILGYRHITRPAPWEPFPQARYIAGLIDDQGRTLAEVADLLERGESEVRSFYRNYCIFMQAKDEYHLEDPERITDSFGVFTRAMQNPNIRWYVGAPDPRDVDPERWPLDDDAAEALEQMVTWLFGSPRTGQLEESRPPRPGQVLLDSRQITQLGYALSEDESREALENGETLDDALSTLADPLDALIDGLRTAQTALVRAQHEIGGENGRIAGLIADIEAALSHYEERALAGPGS